MLKRIASALFGQRDRWTYDVWHSTEYKTAKRSF